MNILVTRKYKKADYTIGVMYINGKRFCDTLENPVRVLNSISDKVHGSTAIPSGVYPIRYTMSPRFNKMLPEICDVPYFSGIRVHAGNYAKDTDGCILLGENKVKGGLINSRKWVQEFCDLMADAYKRGEDSYISII